MRHLPLLTIALCLAFAGSASAATYTQSNTTAVPPSSDFSGSAGGDGWAVAPSETRVFNVFHHTADVQVACHEQSNAASCFGYPKVVTSDTGAHFQSAGHPGLSLDQETGKLYTYAVDRTTVTAGKVNTAGVLCIDTTSVAANPFCGFTALSNPGEATFHPNSGARVTVPMQVGTRWYSFNYVAGQAAGGPTGTGTQNRILCFDLSTQAACPGQPYAVTLGGTVADTPSTVPPTTAAFGSKLVIPLVVGGANVAACYDTATSTDCWGAPKPVAINPYNFGTPFPLLDTSGTPTGFCFPAAGVPCYSLSTGAPVATPAGITSIVGASENWAGPGLTIGPRAYIPQPTRQIGTSYVACYDYSQAAPCAPVSKKFLPNLNLLYSVNRDPYRPTCLWVNADEGTSQIQSFDAYTGGACGQGETRFLTSEYVVPQEECYPTDYKTLTVSVPQGAFDSVEVKFADGGGNPIAGSPTLTAGPGGVVDLSGVDFSSAAGLPQFLVKLINPTGVTQVSAELKWVADYDADCAPPDGDTTIEEGQQATTLATSLSSGDQSGAHITVVEGSSVVDHTTLTGTHAGGAGGSVTYRWFSDSACATQVGATDTRPVETSGVMPDSTPVTLNTAGTYRVIASYSGDAGNLASADDCGDETVVVKPPNAAPSSSEISGASTAPEGGTQSYSVTATDPDSDALTYAWSVVAGAAAISGSSSGASASVTFSDGPSDVSLQVVVDDGQGHTVTKTLAVTATNVAPTATVTGDDSVGEGAATHTYTYTLSDVGADTVTAVDRSCGANGVETASDADARTFTCTFPDGASGVTSVVSVTPRDSDGADGSPATVTVAIANVAPAVELSGPTPVTESQGPRRYSYTIADPGQDSVSTVETSCGTGGVKSSDTHTDTGGGFVCTFVNGPATPTVTVSVNDSDGGAGTDALAVAVSDPQITVTGVSFSAVEGVAFTDQNVAGFTDPTGYSAAGDYAATITWGDGSSSAGKVVKVAAGKFDVTGSHTYTSSDVYLVTVTVTDTDNAANTHRASSPATVAKKTGALPAPGTRPCTSRRRFGIHLQAPRGFRPRTAVLRVGGSEHRVPVVRVGKNFKTIVDLSGRPKGKVTVRFTIRGIGRPSIRTTRHYRLCAPRTT